MPLGPTTCNKEHVLRDSASHLQIGTTYNTISTIVGDEETKI